MDGLNVMPSVHPHVEHAAARLRVGDLTEDEYEDVVRRTKQLQRNAVKVVAANTAANSTHLAEVHAKLQQHLPEEEPSYDEDDSSLNATFEYEDEDEKSIADSPGRGAASSGGGITDASDTTVLSAIVEVKASSAVDQKSSKGSAEEQAEWRGRYLVLKAEGLIEAAEGRGGKQAWRLGLHGLFVEMRDPVSGALFAGGSSAALFELQLRQPLESGDGEARSSECLLRMRFHQSEDIDRWMLALKACCKNARPLDLSRSRSSKIGIKKFFS
jgi:hypothetical protein